MSISDNIKRIREAHGLTQQQLGEIAGVSDKAVSTWESGINVPRMGAVEKMSKYFGIPKSAIIDDTEKSGYFLTQDEICMLRAYRLAESQAQEYALDMLLSHPQKNGQENHG